ncbi:hypothetical protein [Psychrobacter sp. H7-1]|uniref:hypothetical protein n=1 Tax=Psychrobacter sp. H7-1 TaxID=1569265 RepID=UPI00191B6D4E|nr:hypothetical protein [Psychrobacter sp. H7-1]
MSLDPNSRYVVLCNGEAIIPEFTDCILDYWTAETVAEFIKTLNLDIEISIKQVSFINIDPKAVEQRKKWRVLK